MATIFSEGFETDGNGTRYTTSVPEFSDGAFDFFTRTDGSNITGAYSVSGFEGSFSFAAQDLDGENGPAEVTLAFNGIDISGFTNLSLSALLAEDDDGSNEDWDDTDSVRFEYQIDGGGFQNAFAVEADPATYTSTGGPFNGIPALDTDFDGEGDGAAITDTFAQAAAGIAGTGASLDVRVTFALDSGDEDLAIDAITVAGDAPMLEAPTPAAEGTLQRLGRVDALAGAEISSFDPTTDQLFVASGDIVSVVDLSDPANPTADGTIDPGLDVGSEGEVTSVDVANGILAVAFVAGNATDAGRVAFYSTADRTFLGDVTVGSLPDGLAFSADGSTVVVANEGEPGEDDGGNDVDPAGSISVITVNGDAAGGISPTVETLDFSGFDFSSGDLQDVRLFPDTDPANDIEPEFVTATDDPNVFVVSLQEANALAIVDTSTPQIVSIQPLGAKNHALEGNEIDPSDDDGGVNFGTFDNLFGLYMPDAVASFGTGADRFTITANEGDARDEDERIADLTLDPTAFPDAAALQDDAVLGRLEVSTIDGDTDGDGDFDALYAYGGRSFSIFDADGNLVFDSGSQIAAIVNAETPELHNANDTDPGEFDARSDNKGAEPEGVVVGEINGTTYAFIGLERVGSIQMWDVSDPAAPVYVDSIAANDPTTAVDDVAPEGLSFISADDSPNGAPLLAVTYEDTNSIQIFEIDVPQSAFTLELLHIADQEASTGAIEAAPNLSAVMNALEAEDLGDDGVTDNTIRLSSGDAIIPGVFFSASEAVFGTAGIADIQIQNELGLQAIALGNHEFDLGTTFLAGLIDGSAPGDFSALIGSTLEGEDFAGTDFPYLSANLDFSTDAALGPLEVAGGQAPQGNVVTSSTVVEENGELIGVVGATTPTLDRIASPDDVGVLPSPFDSNPTPEQLDALAAEIQAEVDALLAANADMDKVILLSHMQQIAIEFELATRLSGVDIIVAGGSNTRLFDENDRPRDGDSDQGEYPQFFEDADGNPIAVVNTDGSYKYVGRLVIDFDENGNIIPESYDADVSGAFATDEEGVLGTGADDTAPFELSEAQEVGVTVPDTAATGSVSVESFNPQTGEVTISGTFSGLTDANASNALFNVGPAEDAEGNPQSAIHLHNAAAGANGPIVRNFTVTDNGDGTGSFTGTFTFTDEETAAFLAGETYVNLHTTDFNGGQLRGQVDIPAGVAEAGLIDPEIQDIVDAIEEQIIATESNVFGISDVFLNGNRSGTFTADDPDGVRTQETNLGNLTADANLDYAKDFDTSVVVSIKNGGGIRASIGETVVPAGGSEAIRTPNSELTDGDGNLIKPEGGISQNDIATTLAFNNGLTLLTLTKAELLATLENGVGALPSVSGGFPQISGVEFSFDPDAPSGSRIIDAAVVDTDGSIISILARDGELVGDASETFRIVTLNFLADGGDSTFVDLTNPERVDLIDLDGDGVEDGNTTGAATFADDGSEQDALAEYLNENFNPDNGGTAFAQADTGPQNDERIQNLQFRDSDVLPDLPVAIYVIQGAGHLSEFAGETVTTSGIVTALAFNGYYLQDAQGDGDDATSDGIFVFTGSGNVTVAVGDEVEVAGTVEEFIPGGAGTGNLSITQIAPSSESVLSSGNALPASVLIGQNGRAPSDSIVISDSELPTNLQTDPAVFNPDVDAIDFYESLEGMIVTIDDPVAISQTRQFSPFSSEGWVLADDGEFATGRGGGLNDRGGITINADADGRGDLNPERIQLQYDPTTSNGAPVPELTVGDKLANVTGVVGYDFGAFQVNITEAVAIEEASELTPEVTQITGEEGSLTVATYNVLNLSAESSDDAQRDAIAAQIASNLGSPDIIALQEIQDNNGTTDDGTVDADLTLQALVDAIAAAGGPTYAFADVDPIDNTQGGAPGGNIRNAFLWNPEEVSLNNLVALDEAELTSIGVTDPTAFNGSRVPLLGTFGFGDTEVTIINNHFSSRFGSTPIFGGPQPFVQAGEAEREAQAKTNNEVVDFILADDPFANVVVAGDLNTFEFTDELTEDLPGVGDERVLTNLNTVMEGDENYTFNFNGNSQALDHVFVTDGLLQGAEADVVHVNVDFTFPDFLRPSDHEPIVFSLSPFNTVVGDDGDDVQRGTAGRDRLVGNDGDDIQIGRAGDDEILGGEGDDTQSGGGGEDTLFGDDGDDVQAGGGDDDKILGGDGDDVQSGNAGDDHIEGEDGDDVQGGGLGEDTIRGGEGDDVQSGAAGDDLLFGDEGDDVQAGGEGDDIIVGGDGDDSQFGGAGDDVQVGQFGDDILDGNSGDDIQFGGLGDDVLFGRAGDDDQRGGLGDDDIAGGAGNDTQRGGVGDDEMNGGAGDDHQRGGIGDDSLVGAAGDDSQQGGIGDDLLRGGAGNDTQRGGIGDDDVYGDSGDDLIFGRIGDDNLFGGDGDDDLRGCFGDDMLHGGEGNDTMKGGLGEDIFGFAVGDGMDIVREFELSSDVLMFDGLGEDDVAVEQDGDNAVIRYGTDDTVTLRNTLAADLSDDNFLFG